MGWPQREAAQRAGVAYRTRRRLETEGRASLDDLVKASVALRCEDALDTLFPLPAASSLDALLAQQTAAAAMATARVRAPRSRSPRRRALEARPWDPLAGGDQERRSDHVSTGPAPLNEVSFARRGAHDALRAVFPRSPEGRRRQMYAELQNNTERRTSGLLQLGAASLLPPVLGSVDADERGRLLGGIHDLKAQ